MDRLQRPRVERDLAHPPRRAIRDDWIVAVAQLDADRRATATASACRKPGYYRELLNSDAAIYGGSNVGNQGGLEADAIPAHGRPYSLNLTLPPLGAVILKLRDRQ